MKKSILITLSILSFGLVSSFAQDRTPPSSSELIEKMDKDNDGKISKAEVKGKLSKQFDTADSDKDGFLTETELDQFKPKKGNKPKKGEMDTDGDGKISKSEAKGRLAEHFDDADTDNDGYLSRDEMKAHKDSREK